MTNEQIEENQKFFDYLLFNQTSANLVKDQSK